MIHKLFRVTLEILIILIQQECGNSNFFLLVQGQVNSHNVLVQRKFYLSQKADNAQTIQLSPSCADTKGKLF